MRFRYWSKGKSFNAFVNKGFTGRIAAGDNRTLATSGSPFASVEAALAEIQSMTLLKV
jgi:hypothetical protein